MSKNYYAVIMAGGAGTRLWPMSRKNLPKQLQKLVSEKTLIQETFDRIAKALPAARIFVSTNTDCVGEIKNQLPDIPAENYIIEPEARNTAPAIGYIATFIGKRDPKAIVATIASDHSVQNEVEFVSALNTGYDAIEKNPEYLGTVGLKPTRPDTGLGYIKMGDQMPDHGTKIYKVEKFVEKPDLATAKKYLKSWGYLWNASYFIWRADTLLSWYEKHLPETAKALERIGEAIGTEQFNDVLKIEFAKTDKEPIDTAIVEKLDKVLVVPADLGWSDIGNWSALFDIMGNGETVISRGEHIDHDSENILVYGDQKLVATVGLKDIIVVDTGDVILVANRHRAQEVKELIDGLKTQGKEKYL